MLNLRGQTAMLAWALAVPSLCFTPSVHAQDSGNAALQPQAQLAPPPEQNPAESLAGADASALPSAPTPASSTPATAAPPIAEPESEPPGIADNSFLIEEAYNQEYGVVQHIQVWTKMWVGNDWAYSFTQEWPLNLAPKNQLSYTLQSLHTDPGTGVGWGDLILNYRYQVVQNQRWALAPRFSVLAPTGDSKVGRGAGGWGWQTNLPLSWSWHSRLVTHWNLGATHVPHAKDPRGNRAPVWGYNAGQSFIYAPSKRFNLMLETVFNSTEVVEGPGMTRRVNSCLVSPGLRWAHNLKNGTQIVPGFGFPIGVGSSRGEYGLVAYFSVEHPFAGRRNK